MARFQRGQSGNPAGPKVGTTKRMTVEVRSLAARLFDRDYWNLKYERLHDGTEHPKIESLLLTYAYGLPLKEELQASGAIIQLGPLHALQAALEALGNQPPQTLDAAQISLPDVTVRPTVRSQDAPSDRSTAQ